MLASLTVSAVLVLAAPASTQAPEDAAQQAAEAWLKLIDAGQLGQAHDQSATAFRNAIGRRGFEDAVKAARKPLGTFVSRRLTSRRVTHDLPRAPKGTYVVLTYSAQFQKKAHATETVTMMLDGGKFRGAGYDVR